MLVMGASFSFIIILIYIGFNIILTGSTCINLLLSLMTLLYALLMVIFLFGSVVVGQSVKNMVSY